MPLALDIRQLRQVTAIARAGSFVKASQELGVAQPTLSKNIARIEDQLGFKLFERSHGGVQMTPLCAYIVERAEDITGSASALARELQLLAHGQLGSVRIGVGPAMTPVLMPAFISRVAEAFPQLRVQIVVAPRVNLLTGVIGGDLDMLVISDSEGLAETGLRRLALFKERPIAVARPEHPLCRLPLVTTEAFSAHPGASFSASKPFSPAAVLNAPQIAQSPAGRYMSNDFQLIRSLALSGLATALGMSHLFAADIRDGALRKLNMEIDATLNVIAVLTAAATHSPVLQKLITLLRTTAAENLLIADVPTGDEH